jgi:glycosyltransferase involved in cell wall biosynthesis
MILSKDASIQEAARDRRLIMAVGIATRGRPSILRRTLESLAWQSRNPDMVVVAYPSATDVEDIPEGFPDIVFKQTAAGLTKQRNAILEDTSQADLIVFVDDDFLMARNYLAVIEELFIDRPDVTGATGRVIADGISGPGLCCDEALSLLASAPVSKLSQVRRVFNAYGCNMSLRMEPIRDNRLRFDENLPLYGWYEDVDFSRQIARYGMIVSTPDAVGVHLGHKGGRTSGERLGYSQVANPIYLSRKGTFPWLHTVYSISVRVLKNLARSTKPEPWVDRRGRLRGNLQGFMDLCRGRLDPKNILL